MSPFALTLSPSPNSPRKRALSYGGLGGLVTIEDLRNEHDNDNDNRKFSWPHWKRRDLSPRPSGEHERPNTNNNVLMSPFRSEGWRTPDTPRTPTHSQFVHDANPIKYDIQLSASDISYENSPANTFTASPRVYEQAPIELAGSLLLPSQGFIQSDPPLVPPRLRPPLRKSSDQSTSSSTPSSSTPSLSTSSSTDAEMTDQPNAANSFTTTERMLGRTSAQQALHLSTSQSTMTLRSGCPIPLSQMSIEGLMGILPNLDAAIIAHDWIPCMQKRHKELKTLYQQFAETNQVSNDQLKNLDKDLLNILNESQDLATTFKDLFRDAEELAARDNHANTIAADRIREQLCECLRVLARQNTEKKEQAAQYARDLREHRNKTRNVINMFSNFIHDNLGEALNTAPANQVQQIIRVMADSANDSLVAGEVIDASSYDAICHALQDCQDELRDAREVVYEQQAMIKDQSSQLEEYHDRFTAAATKVKEQEQQVNSYQKLIGGLHARCSEYQIKIDQLRVQLEKERKKNLALGNAQHSQTHNEQIANGQESLKDAEISNLRRKLERAYRQENKLQAQIRDLISACNKPDTPLEASPNRNPEFRPGLLKRLFASHSKDSQTQSIIPRDVSKFILSLPNSPRPAALVDEINEISQPTSTVTSPHLATSCDLSGPRLSRAPSIRSRHNQNQIQNQTQNQRRNSFELPARLREALNSGISPEINDAIVCRFVSPVPRGLQSRQQITPAVNVRSKSDDSTAHTTAHPRPLQRQTRPRLNSEPGPEPGPRELDTTVLPCSTSAPAPHDTKGSVVDSYFATNHVRALSGITEVSEHSNEAAEPDRVRDPVVHQDASGRDTIAKAPFPPREISGLPASASDIQIYRQSLNTLERLYFD